MSSRSLNGIVELQVEPNHLTAKPGLQSTDPAICLSGNTPPSPDGSEEQLDWDKEMRTLTRPVSCLEFYFQEFPKGQQHPKLPKDPAGSVCGQF